MDRTFVYPGELPRVEDFLGFQKQAYNGLGALIRSAIGPNPGISNGDFAISATGPASMNVVIGTGSVYAAQTLDSVAFGVLGTDPKVLMKQGISYSPVTLPITAPATSGYSQYYLVQVGFSEEDGDAIVPPFLNSANPTIPWNGANNTGASLNTIRYDLAIVSLVAGTAAPTGTQVVPSPSAGNLPLWVILVDNSTTSITSANWYQSPSFPGFPYLEGINSSTFVPVIPSTTFYVATPANGGNDSNPGTLALPFATPNGAIAYITQFFSQGQVTINIGAGTFNSNASVNGSIMSIPGSLISSWLITGAGLSSTLIDGSATGGRGIYVASGVHVDILEVTILAYYDCILNQGYFGIVGTTQLIMTTSSSIGINNNSGVTSVQMPYGQYLYINGTGLYAVYSAVGGNILFGYHDIDQTFYGEVVFNTTTTVTYVLVAENSGTIEFFPGYSSWGGTTPTASRCYVGTSGGIDTGGQAAFSNPTSYSSPGSVTSWIPATTDGYIYMPGWFS